MRTLPRVMIFCEYFLPGYRAGGPIKSVKGILLTLNDQFRFSVWTRDHDLGNSEVYSAEVQEDIREKLSAEIRYLRAHETTMTEMVRAMKKEIYELVYLNSFFSWRFSIQYIFLRWMGILPKARVVLAPRGEFSPGALQIKSLKKRFYLRMSSFLGFYQGITFQVSNEKEKAEVLNLLERYGITGEVFEASDLIFLDQGANLPLKKKNKNQLKLVFMSRISPMKNLETVLMTLQKVQTPVTLDIFGPVDEEKDQTYFEKCRSLGENLSPYHSIRFLGPVEASKVIETLNQYDVLFLPTRGENFGHIIFEALQAGCLPLISDQTPWSDLARAEAGIIIAEEKSNEYVNAINQLLVMDDLEWHQYQIGMKKYLQKKMSQINETNKIRYSELFRIGGLSTKNSESNSTINSI